MNDSAAFNAGLIASAMEKLTDWWSQQAPPADRTPATLVGAVSRAIAMPESAAPA